MKLQSEIKSEITRYSKELRLPVFRKEFEQVAQESAKDGADRVAGPYTFIKEENPNAGKWPMNYPEELKSKSFPDNMNYLLMTTVKPITFNRRKPYPEHYRINRRLPKLPIQ